jgi:hypothetical protein
MHRYLLLLALVFLCACQTNASAGPVDGTPTIRVSPAPSVDVGPSPEPLATSTLTQTVGPPASIEEQAWANSPHALPPTATVQPTDSGAPASAVVPCSACHKEDGGTVTGSKIAWWNATAQQYESVADVNTLCQKCHDQLRPSNGLSTPKSDIHGGFECTACHDPHTTAASCSNSTCHTNIRQTSDMPPSTPMGGHPFIGGGGPFCGGTSCHPAATAAASQPRSVHGAAHRNVTCEACHAAGDVTARPGKDGGPWIPLQTTPQPGKPTAVPYFSHAVKVEVDCQRCHLANNPWSLPAVTGNEFQK